MSARVFEIHCLYVRLMARIALAGAERKDSECMESKKCSGLWRCAFKYITKRKLLKDLLFKKEMEMESHGDDFNNGITIMISYNYGINWYIIFFKYWLLSWLF